MSRLLIAIYRRLDRLQRNLWVKVVLSVLMVAACAGYFGVLLAKSYSLQSQRVALYNALANQNLQRHDDLAVSLNEHGDVFVNGRTYGGPQFKNPRIPWFDQEGNIAALDILVAMLLADQVPSWAPHWLLDTPLTTQVLAAATVGWLLLIIWLEITLPFLLTLLGTAIPVGIAYLMGWPQAMLSFAGMGLLTFTFVVLTRGSLLMLNWPYQPLAVAHTLVKEASRIKISLVFIVLLLVILPLLPLGLDPANPLRYRVQTFISRSIGLTFAIAACMTLFLSCASVAFEIRDRQIWQLMTKPVGRLNYLIGKWLGVMVVNLNILLVAGVSTFTFIQYLSRQPVAGGAEGEYDALAVRDEVLTARLARRPDYQVLNGADLTQRVEQRLASDPQFAGRTDISLAERRHAAVDIQQQFSTGQRTIPPGQSGARKYVFSGLGNVRQSSVSMTLRYRLHIMRDDEHLTFNALFVFLDKDDNVLDQWKSTYVPTISHSLPLSTNLIQDDGTLRVGIINLFEPPPENRGFGALNFEEKDFELFYKVGSFEGNFLRAIVMSWLKLAFLAALGICCATFLSFPVACLMSFTIFVAGLLGPFLAEALEYYGSYEFSKLDWHNLGMVLQWAFEAVTSAIASTLVYLLGGFGEYRPTQDLVEGRLIPWTSVFSGFFRLAILWSGLSMLIGWIVMRQRQLAIYSGHG